MISKILRTAAKGKPLLGQASGGLLVDERPHGVENHVTPAEALLHQPPPAGSPFDHRCMKELSQEQTRLT